MARSRHLRNAPITEALIDFRVVAPTGFEPESLLSLKDRLAREYPKAFERRDTEADIQLAPGKPATTRTRDLGLQGLFFKSEDELNIVQFRNNGFTFNRLKPYTAWTEILPEAMRLWDLYIAVAKPESVSRVALRYINHIRVPLPIHDLAEYLTAPPITPPGMPQQLSSFLTRVIVHEENHGLAATVTQAFEQGLDPQAATVILDIDAFKTGAFKSTGNDIRLVLDQLHDLKNNIFFSSVTDKALRPYE